MRWQTFVKDSFVIKNAVEKGYERLIGMLITEFDEEKFVKDLKEEGRIEGLEEANRTHAFKMIKKGYSDEAISEIIECSILDVQKLRRELEEKESHQ